MLLAVAVVVLEVITLGFQGVVVFVFDLPPAASGGNHLRHLAVIERQGRCKAVVIQHVAFFIGGGELAPIDQQGVIPIAEGNRLRVAIGVDLAPLAGPPPADHGVDGPAPVQKLDPFGHEGMGRRLADQDEAESPLQRLAAERFVAVQVIPQERDPERTIVVAPGGASAGRR